LNHTTKSAIIRVFGLSRITLRAFIWKIISLQVILSLVASSLFISASKVMAKSEAATEKVAEVLSTYQAPRYSHPEPVIGERPSDELLDNISEQPILFIENEGQSDQEVRYQVYGENATISFVDDGLWLTVIQPESVSTSSDHNSALGDAGSMSPTPMPGLNSLSETQESEIDGVNIRAVFEGANPSPEIVGFDPIDTNISFFRGNDPSDWQSDVPVWSGIRYIDIYPGYNLEVTSENGQLLQRLVPNETVSDEEPSLFGFFKSLFSKPPELNVRFEGAQSVEEVDGQRTLLTEIGEIPFPIIEESALENLSDEPVESLQKVSSSEGMTISARSTTQSVLANSQLNFSTFIASSLSNVIL